MLIVQYLQYTEDNKLPLGAKCIILEILNKQVLYLLFMLITSWNT